MAGALLYSGTEKRGHLVTLTADWFHNHIAASHRDFDRCWPFPTNRSTICQQTCHFFLCLDDALHNPIVLMRDKDHDARDNYYGPPVVSLAAIGVRYAFLQLCVEFRNSRGRVITAFSVDNVHPNDRA